MASYITNYGSDQLLDWAFNSSGMYLALGTGYISGSGSSSGNFAEITSGLGYSRIFVSGWVVTSGVASPNTSGITFGPAINSGWVVSVLGVFDASSGGNLWWAGAANPSGTVNIAQNASFASGQIQIGFQASGA